MTPKLRALVVCVALGLGGCTSIADHVETQQNRTGYDLQWRDRWSTSAPKLRPILDRIAVQEGGDWSGAYSLKELEQRLPPALKSDEFRKWTSAFNRPDEVDYYVISTGAPYAYRRAGDMIDSIGRFPVCVFVVYVGLDGASYRRFVFNATGGTRRVGNAEPVHPDGRQ